MRLSRRAFLVGAGASFASPALAQDVFAEQGLRVDGADRRYRLVRPEGLPAGAPLVIALHGIGDSPANMARYSHLDDAARENGWLLAYPRASGRSWPTQNEEAQAREISYVAALMDALIGEHGCDANRVHMAGFSRGGYFVNVVAARLSERVASIVAHSGGAGGLALSGINAARKYPVMVVHGDADRSVPVSWGRALADQYRREGHATEYWEIPRMPHIWAVEHGANARIAEFFNAHPLA